MQSTPNAHTHTYIHTYSAWNRCTWHPAPTIMFVISVYECPHAVVPQLHHSGVQTGQHPWTDGVEGNACSNTHKHTQSDVQTDSRHTEKGRPYSLFYVHTYADGQSEHQCVSFKRYHNQFQLGHTGTPAWWHCRDLLPCGISLQRLMCPRVICEKF